MAARPGPFTKALGGEIRRKRRESFLTQQQLADLLNETSADLAIDRASISRWESAKRRPSLGHLEVLVRVLGVSEEIARLAVNEKITERDQAREVAA